MTSTFPIPNSLQDLERAPYNLLPYPIGFEDDDEATRAESFDELVLLVERGNRTLRSGMMALFETPDGEDGFDEWNDNERMQALYTLVRKSCSLATGTRVRVATAVCQAVKYLSECLSTSTSEDNDEHEDSETSIKKHNVVSQSFRDAFACHIYMLYSLMVFTESETKAGKAITNVTKTPAKSKKKGSLEPADSEKIQLLREASAEAMLHATRAMTTHRSKLWKRGVPDENIINIPCKISYQMLETATGVIARKASSGDLAMEIIALMAQSYECLMNTIVSALVDLLHSYEHMSSIVAELCCLIEGSDKLTIEIIKEIGHLDGGNSTSGDTGAKASGIKNVAPFINEIAEKKPELVRDFIHVLLPHLDSEPYNLRSAIVTAIGHIIVKCSKVLEYESTKSKNDGDDEDVFEEEINEKKRILKIRDDMFEVLIQRVHDVSSYSRVAVLKTWLSLVENNVLPVKMVLSITKLAIDRLQDKTVMVRRIALQILGMLLERNPFNGSLAIEPYQAKLKEVQVYLLNNLPAHLNEAKEATLSELEEEGDGENISEREEIEKAVVLAAVTEYEDNNTVDESERVFTSKLTAWKYLNAAIEFIRVFESANGAFESMLRSSNTTDVTEALRFFVRARHFQLSCAVSGIKQALSLMWSNETSIQEEVLQAFIEVFISVPGTGGAEYLPAKDIVNNLLLLVNKATVSELACIEEAIGRLVKDQTIPADVFLILWSIAAKASGQARSAAMLILSMGASTDRSIVDSASRLRHLLEAGLGEYTEEHRDWSTARSAACALQRVSRVKCPDPTSAKFIVLEQIVERLCEVIQGDWCDDNNTKDTLSWFSASEQSINAIFVICPEPEHICKVILRAMTTSTFGCDATHLNVHSLRLARFFFVMSHIALKLLVYTEALSSSVRRANAARTLAKQEKVDKAKASNDANEEEESDDEIEAELGMAQAAEAETERNLADIAESEIVGRGFIGIFAPLLVRIVANQGGQYGSEILMQTATISLCKLMCISSSFCEKYLPLLFTTLANAPAADITLRANTVIALGDLAFRFPNEVEPYTPRLYACLRDKSNRVRRHTLMVLTHLILNDMIKVKGQVCEIALCLQDEEIRIRDMARLLFFELSKRSNNPIYNLLPDIVSRLSNMTIAKDDFRSIMSYLLSFIKKEKQNEMLVDKLCHRFLKCSTISQKGDISYCLAQVKLNDKCIKILNDNFKLYKDALFDDDVYNNFASIVTKMRKFAKPEMRECLDEWETKLNESKEIGLDNNEVDNKIEHAKKLAVNRRPPRRNTKKHVASVEDDSESDGEEEEDDENEENHNLSEDEFEFNVDVNNKENKKKSNSKTPSKKKSIKEKKSTSVRRPTRRAKQESILQDL